MELNLFDYVGVVIGVIHLTSVLIPIKSLYYTPVDVASVEGKM